VRVWTSPHASEGWTRLHLAVVDNGIGLSREEHEVLLKGEVFTQVGKGQLQGRGGTGLGLNIVRHILRLHDESELFINSKGLWQGTTFEMRINLHHTHATSTNLSSADQDFLQQRTTKSAREQVASRFSHGQGAQRANSSSHSSVDAVSQSPFSNLLGYHGPSASPPSHRASHKAEDRVTSGLELSSEFSFSQGAVESRCSVLHVEDDLMLQMTFRVMLFERLGALSTTASNGQEALQMLREQEASGHPYTLVVMDNQMPIMGGAETGAAMRQAGFTGVMIGITGDPEGSPERDNFRDRAGLDECVDKTQAGMQLIENHILSQLGRTSEGRCSAYYSDEGSDGEGSEILTMAVNSEPEPESPLEFNGGRH